MAAEQAKKPKRVVPVDISHYGVQWIPARIIDIPRPKHSPASDQLAEQAASEAADLSPRSGMDS